VHTELGYAAADVWKHLAGTLKDHGGSAVAREMRAVKGDYVKDAVRQARKWVDGGKTVLIVDNVCLVREA
jgi:hypothetical protein